MTKYLEKNIRQGLPVKCLSHLIQRIHFMETGNNCQKSNFIIKANTSGLFSSYICVYDGNFNPITAMQMRFQNCDIIG